MSELDDRPLFKDSADMTGLTSPRRSHTTLFVIATLGLVLGGAAAWWWTRTPPAPPSSMATDAVLAPEAEAARPLPPLDQMDTFLRALLGALSASPELARWLATDDLIRQMANGIDRVSRGFSPARDVPVLRPPGTFEVSTGRQTMVDPESFRRYDGLATLVASVDAQSVADAYRTIQPRLDEAYRGLGRTAGNVDQAVSVALQTLIDTPVAPPPIAVVPGTGATWAYADPQLEGLRPVQKQLLRMGPENVARVTGRLREIKAAIDASSRQ